MEFSELFVSLYIRFNSAVFYFAEGLKFIRNYLLYSATIITLKQVTAVNIFASIYIYLLILYMTKIEARMIKCPKCSLVKCDRNSNFKKEIRFFYSVNKKVECFYNSSENGVIVGE